jgi:DNA-binding transcriptional regulator YiaG
VEIARDRFLLIPEKIAQPVEVARALRDFGMPLRQAHAALNVLAKRQVVAVELNANDSELLASRLAGHGVKIARLSLPSPDVKKIREGFGLSQSEFALRFFLEVDTVRNWEQGRNKPDPAARTLLRIIERSPWAVDSALIDNAEPDAHCEQTRRDPL